LDLTSTNNLGESIIGAAKNLNNKQNSINYEPISTNYSISEGVTSANQNNFQKYL